MTTFIKYKSYSFVNKDPIINKLRTVVKNEKLNYRQLQKNSGVSYGTIINWFQGSTKRPQHATIMAVIRGMGYDMILTKGNKI